MPTTLRKMLVMALMSPILLCSRCLAVGMNVALHAQVPPSTGVIVGSAVTMTGLKSALLKHRNATGVENLGIDHISRVEIFYPFNYVGLHDREWDLVIIEGWFEMINVFIHEVRAISFPRDTTVLYFCLDPQFPGLHHVSALDVDGFLTNSESSRASLDSSAPAKLVLLAADPERFSFFPNPPPLPVGTSAARAKGREQRGREGGGHVRSDGRIVYVGAGGALDHKSMLAWMLREAAPFGLDIYGSGWQDIPEFSIFWRGTLPEEDLAAVYGTALAVIGVTMDAQRDMGMVNNRVFEAVAVGVPLITDHFPALEALFGDLLLYVRSRGDARRHIQRLLENSIQDAGRKLEEISRQRRRTFVEEGHTWGHRATQLLQFASSLSRSVPSATRGRASLRAPRHESPCPRSGCPRSGCPRSGCPRLAIVVDPRLRRDVTFASTFPAAVDELTLVYRVDWWTVPGEDDHDKHLHLDDILNVATGGGDARRPGHSGPEWQPLPADRGVGWIKDYDIVWAVGHWGGEADAFVRREVGSATVGHQRVVTASLGVQVRGIVLWGQKCISEVDAENGRCPELAGGIGLRWYDVVYCQTQWDHARLSQLAFEGAISSNLQQAWGFGPKARVRQPRVGLLPLGKSPAAYDVLLIGTEDQIRKMLEFIRQSGLARVALAVLLSPGDVTAATRADLLSLLVTAGVDVDEDSEGGLLSSLHGVPDRVELRISDAAGTGEPSQNPTEVLFIRRAADATSLVETTFMAAKAVVMAEGELGAWAILAIAAQGDESVAGTVRVASSRSGSRVEALARERPEAWDASFYSRRLMGGITRALCLGRGSSRISLLEPAARSSRVVGASDTVAVRVVLEDFDTGRDGQWCVTGGTRTLLCVLRDRISVVIDFDVSSLPDMRKQSLFSDPDPDPDPDPDVDSSNDGKEEKDEKESEGDRSSWENRSELATRGVVRVELGVELRSNMYRDVLNRSEKAILLIDPTGSRTYGEDFCVHADGTTISCRKLGHRHGHRHGHGHGHSESPEHSNYEETEVVRATMDIEDLVRSNDAVVVKIPWIAGDQKKKYREMTGIV